MITEFYLVGGTAIALHLGHRRSIDFDIFKPSRLNHRRNFDRIADAGFPYQVTRRVEEQMNLIVNAVKVTFFQYPFPVVPEEAFGSALSAMSDGHGACRRRVLQTIHP